MQIPYKHIFKVIASLNEYNLDNLFFTKRLQKDFIKKNLNDELILKIFKVSDEKINIEYPNNEKK